jgi:hypothetical protein
MKTFDPALLTAINSPPSCTRLAAISALQLWSMLPLALAEAEARRDDAMATRLVFLSNLLSAADD